MAQVARSPRFRPLVASSAIERGYRKYFRYLRAVVAVLLWCRLQTHPCSKNLAQVWRPADTGWHWSSAARYDLELSRQHQPRSTIQAYAFHLRSRAQGLKHPFTGVCHCFPNTPHSINQFVDIWAIQHCRNPFSLLQRTLPDPLISLPETTPKLPKDICIQHVLLLRNSGDVGGTIFVDACNLVVR